MRTDCFIHFITQLLIWHWETTKYSSHIALGDGYKAFGKLADRYIETYQGKNPRLPLPTFDHCPDYTSVNKLVPIFTWFEEYLLIYLVKDLDETKDKDLLTIRDEMLAELNHLLYLLTLE
jgi:hypothetical protein